MGMVSEEEGQIILTDWGDQGTVGKPCSMPAHWCMGHNTPLNRSQDIRQNNSTTFCENVLSCLSCYCIPYYDTGCIGKL